jgi:hypothetical protein
MKHVSKDHSKLSTPALEFLWWRADISKEDVRWVRQHLGRGLDGAKEFEVYPDTFVNGYGPIGRDWPQRVHFSQGSTAMQFMQQFGPLTWKMRTGRRGEEGWVDLADFWDRHTRFIAVMQLWESRFDVDGLKNSWRWIYERLDRINRVGPAEFGAMPNWNFDKFHEFPGVFPWERGGIENGLQNPHSILLQTTQELIHYELNLHTQECRQIWMMQSVGRDQDVRFQPIRSYGSLWGVIWDLFGQDVSTLTHGWRVCLECGRRFYPKDHRSVCCTSKHQALWSKRKWAREHRKPRMLSQPGP